MPVARRTTGGGIGASKAAKVAPAPPVHRNSLEVGHEIKRLTAEILQNAEKLRLLQKQQHCHSLRKTVERSRSKSAKSRSTRSSQMQQLSDKISSNMVVEVPEEDGGALTPKERALLALEGRARQAARKSAEKRAANGEGALGFSKTGKPLSAWQSFVQLRMVGVPQEHLGKHLKKIAAEWKAMKKASGGSLLDHLKDAEPSFAAVMPPGGMKWVYDKNSAGKITGRHLEPLKPIRITRK